MTEYVSSSNLHGLALDLRFLADDTENLSVSGYEEQAYNEGVAEGLRQAVQVLEELIAKAGEEID